jgi:riboflavin synthase
MALAISPATAGLAKYIAPKGSICIDGVSLTVNGVDGEVFEVNLIPHTLEVTTLGALAPGSAVNLEADVLGKYVRRYLARIERAPSPTDGGA